MFEPSLEQDVFISYAHADNETLDQSLRGWVDLLEERLRVRLKQLLGKERYKEIEIWRDARLRGYGDFSDELIAQLARTKIFISILSPSYIQSEWCQRELTVFCNRADKARVLKIVKTHIERDEQPEVIRNLLGYDFYKLDESSNKFREFDPYLLSTRDIDYWKKFDDLCIEASELIEKLRLETPPSPAVKLPVVPASIASSSSPPSNGAANGQLIYLAKTASDLDNARDSIRRAFSQHITILPKEELPGSAPELIDSVRACLSQARLSVHLIGSRYGIIPEMEESRSVVRLQYDLASERTADNKFSRLVWLPKNLAPAEKRQLEFLEFLRRDANAGSNDEVIESDIEELKTIIQSRLDAVQSSAPGDSPDQPPDDGVQPRVYLMCDREDRAAVKPIFNLLAVESGFSVTLSKTDGGVAEIRQHRKENLLSCSAVLIFFGKVTFDWLGSQLDELRKVSGYGRKTPFLARAIFAAGPATDEKEMLESDDPLIIKNFDGFKPDSLAEFMNRIRAGKGGSQ